MGLKFEPKKFKFGMRTLKTGVAVFLVLGLFSAFGWDGLQIGCLTAVFSLRENFDRSVQFGKSVIGGVAALLIITLSIPPDNTFTYVIARVFETFCGVFIAILVNYDYDWLLKHLK